MTPNSIILRASFLKRLRFYGCCRLLRLIHLNMFSYWKSNPVPFAVWRCCWKTSLATLPIGIFRPLWLDRTAPIFLNDLPTGRKALYFRRMQHPVSIWIPEGTHGRSILQDRPFRWCRHTFGWWSVHRNRDRESRYELFSPETASWPPAIRTLIGRTTFARRQLWRGTGWVDC